MNKIIVICSTYNAPKATKADALPRQRSAAIYILTTKHLPQVFGLLIQLKVPHMC